MVADIPGAVGANIYKILAVGSLLYSIYYAWNNGIKAGAVVFGKLWVSSLVIGLIAAFASGFIIVGGTTIAYIVVFLLLTVVIIS